MEFQLIITIVNKGYSEDVINAAKRAGAQGATVLNGRGSGIHEQARFFGFQIEPEKELVLNIVPKEKTEAIMASIGKEIDIAKPGNGVGFVLDISSLVGISVFSGGDKK